MLQRNLNHLRKKKESPWKLCLPGKVELPLAAQRGIGSHLVGNALKRTCSNEVLVHI